MMIHYDLGFPSAHVLSFAALEKKMFKFCVIIILPCLRSFQPRPFYLLEYYTCTYLPHEGRPSWAQGLNLIDQRQKVSPVKIDFIH